MVDDLLLELFGVSKMEEAGTDTMLPVDDVDDVLLLVQFNTSAELQESGMETEFPVFPSLSLVSSTTSKVGESRVQKDFLVLLLSSFLCFEG